MMQAPNTLAAAPGRDCAKIRATCEVRCAGISTVKPLFTVLMPTLRAPPFRSLPHVLPIRHGQ